MWKRFWGVAAVSASLLLVVGLVARPRGQQLAEPLPALVVAQGADGSRPVGALQMPQPGLVALPLRIVGRAAPGPEGALRQEWPGFHVSARFEGTEAWVRFNDGINRWRVLLDGGRSGRIDLALPGGRDLHLRGLAPGAHEIRVEKISESFMPANFGGILIRRDAGAALPAPPPAARLIEFIGDSDTVGFANGATQRDCSEAEVFARTDTSASFGPALAAALGTDYRMIARSGIGLLRNYGGAAQDATMRSRYPLALPGEPAASGLPQPAADVVVTGIGSNDFGTELTPGEPWSDLAALSRDFGPALTEFLRARVRENPDALQVLLAFGEYGAPLVEPYREAFAALQADGARATLVVLPQLERSACFWHPSLADHALIAQSLALAIRASERRDR
ncbi:lipase [Paracoccus limosus]|uniref:Lipase n=1 Tax=Paracoccus limosus TaxID=913252 RepID=A0A844H504_9RHOB|nr:SGNH/GDSL hydrolase family protein [Paracoccus limosus]MTH35105.1 lipase [Paracoccus limosus]